MLSCIWSRTSCNKRPDSNTNPKPNPKPENPLFGTIHTKDNSIDFIESSFRTQGLIPLKYSSIKTFVDIIKTELKFSTIQKSDNSEHILDIIKVKMAEYLILNANALRKKHDWEFIDIGNKFVKSNKEQFIECGLNID